MKTFMTFSIAILLLCSAPGASGNALAAFQGQNPTSPQLQGPSSQSSHAMAPLAEEVRHQLVMLPYYGVFDWLEAEMRPNYTVALRGQVTRPTMKSDAEARVKNLESVATVINEIEVLPLSPADDQIRVAMYRAIFNYNSALFIKYATLAVPPIHIIVKNGRVTLKGIVANEMDRQLAYTAARGVPNVFEVKDELKVEQH